MRRVTRRAALGALGLAGGMGLAYGASLGVCRFVPRTRTEFFALLETVPDDRAARLIAMRARATGALPSDAGALARLVEAKPHLVRALTVACPHTRGDLVRRQCREDFARGRTCVLEGWVLSETEAALCALRHPAVKTPSAAT